MEAFTSTTDVNQRHVVLLVGTGLKLTGHPGCE